MDKLSTIWIFILAFGVLQTDACLEDNQDQFSTCFGQFSQIEQGPTFWEDICSAAGLEVLDCLLQTTSDCPQLWVDTTLGNLSSQRDLVYSISPASDDYAVKCERNTIADCDDTYHCFTSVFQQSESTPYTGLSDFYRWFCSNQDGVTYINNCFKQTEGICTSTLDYLRNFEVIQYPDGTALTFQQVSQTAATECDEIGVLVTICQDPDPCVTILDKTQDTITSCLNTNASQCFTQPTIDFGQNILQCDYSEFTSQCIADGCGPKASGFFIRLFKFMDCGTQASTGCLAVSITLQIGQEGYETMTTVTFQNTLPGSTANQTCPTDYEGSLSRRCSSSGRWEPVVSTCIKDILKDIREAVDTLKTLTYVNPVQFQSVLDDLNEVTDPDRDKIDKPPVDEVKDIINDITDIIEKKQETSPEELETFVSIVSNTVDKTNVEEWKIKVKTGASSILLNVEKTIDKTVSSQGCAYKEAVKENIAVTIGASDADIRYVANDDAGEILVPKQALRDKGLNSSVCYGGVHYETVAPLLSRKVIIAGETKELNLDQVVNTDVISLQFEQKLGTIDPPAVLTFALLQRGLRDPVCVSWDFSALSTDGNGAWTSEGCEFVRFSENGEIICTCNHLTNFAVLMSTSKMSEDHIKALSIISAVGCAISIVGLLLTIIFHVLVWRLVRSDRSIILMNLCVALLLALIAFLAGINRTESPEACKAIAALLHFLFLAVFFLMLIQGVEIMICVVHVFVTKFRLKLLLPVAWLIPATIVAISLGVTKTDGYGNIVYCWLSVESGLIWAFLGPVALVIIINIIVIIVVFKKLFSSRAMKDKSAKERAKTSLRSICILLPLLGCTWLFGFLSINNDTVVFQYIFSILNSLQGLFIFLSHCVFNRQLKDALERRRAKKRSMHTFESDFKKRSRTDSLGQDVSKAMTDRNSSESSSKNKSKIHRKGAKSRKNSGEINGLGEWQREQRREYQREVRRQISDKLDWTEQPDWTA